MNVKSFILSSLIGGVVYFLLGWLFYGFLFTEIYPSSDSQNLLFVFLGCLFFAILLAYIFLQWASISTAASGAKAGAFLSLLIGLSNNFFMYSNKAMNLTSFLTDVAIMMVIGAVVGAIVALVINNTK